MNRLHLNWNLETRQERLDFVQIYLKDLYFTPTPDECETMARYILWGKDPETGLNGRQEGLDLPTRSGVWDTNTDSNFESLEALIESPTFSEQIFRKPSDPIIRIPKMRFDRNVARKCAPPETLALLESLWRQIDSTEVLCAEYDFAHGRRTAPLRASLLARFTEAELLALRESASHLNVYTYLKKRHELVDLRRQQYTLKDTYAPPIVSTPTWDTSDAPDLLWGEDIAIAPLNLTHASTALRTSILRPDRFPEPTGLNPALASELSTLLWCPPQSRTFDFANLTDLEKFASLFLDLDDFRKENPFSTISLLFLYWNTYVALTPLKDFQRRLLDLKLARRSNSDIRTILREEFKKTYTINYISTLYHQIILKAIADTAARHREVVENLFFPENFKTCIDCGRTLLRDHQNFVKKSKVSDGFSPRCKQCEKKLRERRRMEEQK